MFYCVWSFLTRMFESVDHTFNNSYKSWVPTPNHLLSLQPFSSGRQVVVERHSREQGLRKEWHGGSSSQERAFPDNRRMGDSRGSLMAPSRYTKFTNKWQNWMVRPVVLCHLRHRLSFSVCSHSSSGMNRIVQITSNSIASGGNAGGFKPYKGTPRQF